MMDLVVQTINNVVGNGYNEQEISVPTQLSPVTENVFEEREQQPSTSSNVENEPSTGTGLQTRSMARVIKKMRLDSNPMPENKEEEKPEIKIPETKPEPKHHEPKQTVRRRPFELWSTEDKNTFFEALNEYGKDFDAIQNYFVTKAKKKALDEHLIKNKFQVRHFYYRTWHKISKHLKFSEVLRKHTRELYALINYGEMRKKIGPVTEKTCVKLNDLVYRGTTQVRSKGKTIRIRTPICRALRKLNQYGECLDDLKLPLRVSVELRPRYNEDWNRVQAAAQNPRVRTVLPLQRRLSVLLAHLGRRWMSQLDKHIERLRESSTGSELALPPSPLLRVVPREGVPITVPKVNLAQYLTSINVCLNTFELRNGMRPVGRPTVPPPTGKRHWKPRKAQEVALPPLGAPASPAEVEVMMGDRTQGDGSATTSQGESSVEGPDPQHPIQQDSTHGTAKPSPAPGKRKPRAEATVEDIRKGWTLENAGVKTIGELYLMFGADSKLQLEYWWEGTKCRPIKVESAMELTAQPNMNPIANTLHKLLSIAKLNYRKAKLQCPCGHVCGVQSKFNGATRGRAVGSNCRLARPTIVESERGKNLECNTNTLKVVGTTVTLSTLQDGVFRRPLLAPSMFKPPPKPGSAEAFRAQLDQLRPRWCGRRGRLVRSKNVVVQRQLPLLPKAPTSQSVVTLKMVNQRSGEFMPIEPAGLVGRTLPHIAPIRPVAPKIRSLAPAVTQPPPQQTPVADLVLAPEISETTLTPRLPSPPSISNLLDMPLSTVDVVGLPIINMDVAPPSFEGLLPSEAKMEVAETPPTSPSRILKEGDHQWLNSEVADFSLSSFLGHLDSPMKATTLVTTAPVSEDTRLSSDVEAQLQCLMMENSVDYMAKFADLAAQIAASSEKK